jgi:hypothetical protein
MSPCRCISRRTGRPTDPPQQRSSITQSGQSDRWCWTRKRGGCIRYHVARTEREQEREIATRLCGQITCRDSDFVVDAGLKTNHEMIGDIRAGLEKPSHRDAQRARLLRYRSGSAARRHSHVHIVAEASTNGASHRPSSSRQSAMPHLRCAWLTLCQSSASAHPQTPNF